MVLNKALKRAIAQLTGAVPPDTAAPVSSSKRPAGMVIWVQVSDPKLLALFRPVYDQLTETFPDLWFLLDESSASGLGETDNLLKLNPDQKRQSANSIVIEWQPDLVLFLGEIADAETAKVAASQDIKTVYVPIENGPDTGVPSRTSIALSKHMLANNSYICTQGPDQTNAWINAGASAGQITEIGALDDLRDPPSCNDNALTQILAELAGRPIWFACNLSKLELSMVIAAHQGLLRKSHRLLLVLAPRDETLLKTAEEMLTISDVSYGLRSTNITPHMDTKVFIADVLNEAGIWHRASPISFLGGTTKTEDIAPHPFDSVALGSVVLHGDQIQPFGSEFDALQTAGASIQVTTEAELGQAVQRLLSPDVAARYAHTGWTLVSEGAVAMDKLVTLLSAQLEARASE